MLSRFFCVPAAALVAVMSTIIFASTTSQQWIAPINATLAGSGANGHGSSASTAPQPGSELGGAGAKRGASFEFLDPNSAASSSSPVLLYAQDWNGAPSRRSTAAWQQAAVTHQVLVGTQGPVYGKMISQLHAWNPSLKVLVYDLGPYTIKGSSDYATLMAQHPTYFAHDAHGRLITVKAASGTGAFPKNTLMDQANPGWQAFQGQRILKNIKAWGYDGAYVDSMGPGVFSGTTTGVPIDPSTGKAFTDTSWMQAGAGAMNAVKAAIGKGKYLLATGLVNGSEYTSFTHILAASKVDGMQTDSWVRVANAGINNWPSANALAADLAMVKSLQSMGKGFFGWTKVWMNASKTQQSAWNTYALAAYLLVDNGVNDYYLFSAPSSSADRTTIYFPNEREALGAAVGPFTLVAGVYHRTFAHGTVTLNTNGQTAAISLVP
jgi:Hypothetical glycosyl hydrolase family 15